MPVNRDVRLAREFHDDTTHTPQSIRTSGHTLEWDIKPFPFKIYTDLSPLALPREVDPLGADTLAALGAGEFPAASRMTLEHLATLLYFAAGVTRKKTYPGGGEVLFRAAPSTGALYQTEVYVAVGDVETGGPRALSLLSGRLRAAPVAPGRRAVGAGRSRRRTCRSHARRHRRAHGDLLAQHLEVPGARLAPSLLGLRHDAGQPHRGGRVAGPGPRLLTGFVDDAVNHALGLDAEREAALELVALGPAGAAAPAVALPSNRLRDDAPVLGRRGTIRRCVKCRRVRGSPAPPMSRPGARARRPRPAVPGGRSRRCPHARSSAGRGLGETIQHRGSTRQFSHQPISLDELATTLCGPPAPSTPDVPAGLADLYLVVNAVPGLEPGPGATGPTPTPGAHPGRRLPEELGVSLPEQALGGDAAAVLYFLAPVDALLAAFGQSRLPSGQPEAGLMGGRAYLAAHAQRFGASGLTFYDREVVRFFAPHASGHDAIFVTALGRAARSP